ncbi:MAG: sigma-70 family RNA polymerase sigma factor [Cyclobacteriaceae bacterium]|nr:sigma-70 family RNA polymerase sigma factor [Cyclobacteriaceae bacterium SS2]
MKIPKPSPIDHPNLSHSMEKTDAVDSKTWERFKEGDEDAFIQIYQEYFVSLYKYGSQFTRSRDIIKDVIQDLFIDLRRQRNRLVIARIKPYLFVSFRRRLILKLKSQSKELALDAETMNGYDFTVEVSNERKIIDQQQQEIDQARLKSAIEKLPDRQREAIYLYYFENLSYQEMKEMMALKDIKSARNLIYKAINSMRDIILGIVLCFY